MSLHARLVANCLPQFHPLPEGVSDPQELLSMVAGREAYVRERIDPRPEDPHYIHLSDLLLCLKQHASDKAIRILDYGAGVSPYASLFPNAKYERADISDVAGIEYVLRADGTVPASSASFDLVLSTQVLEHVASPGVYLAESYRLLRSGGTLILSTHGMFEDHACPNDFQRWTADGLRRDLQAAGFEVEHIYRLSTGTRAMVFQLERWASNASKRPGTMVKRLLKPRVRRILHRQCDRRFPECRAVDGALSGHEIYVAVLAVAHKT